MCDFRVESETVDYSTQYPWMFGVLSVLIATGQHPLGDYPTKYEENQKVRYRTHHIQTLPDPDKVKGQHYVLDDLVNLTVYYWRL